MKLTPTEEIYTVAFIGSNELFWVQFLKLENEKNPDGNIKQWGV